jgi:hypothetical protein
MSRSVWAGGIAVLVACLGGVAWLPAEAGAQDGERPDLQLRARPNLAFAPAEVVFTGRLRGGADDDERFYCVSAEWDWDDGTISESTFDCEPYEPGVSEIRRRFSRRHSFDVGGRYEIRLSLKRGDDIVDSTRTSITIQGE